MKMRKNMKRHGQLIGLDRQCFDDYVRYHESIWPEIAQTIRDCNIRNYSIFQFGNKLFAYFEYVGTDFEQDMQKMADDKKTQEWWALMEPMQRPVENRKEGEWWAEMNEVFHQD